MAASFTRSTKGRWGQPEVEQHRYPRNFPRCKGLELRMRQSPSVLPLDRLDRDIYLVLEDFGARAGCAWRETDEQDTDREAVLRDLLSGQYAYPLRIVAFNAIEGWSRDVTEDIADALAGRAARERLDLSPALEDFVQANSSRPFGLQLVLPLRGAA
ncbi:hypothetical protein ABIA09_000886 [Bradyrhizobium yuanmingense]